MTRGSKQTVVLIFLLILAGWRCAAVAPPGGGPVDTIPPELIAVSPENGTLGFKGGTVELEFSEYIDEKSISPALRVSPRIEKPLKISLRGKFLELEFPRDLEPEQTYVLTLSRELKDEHGVPLAEPIQIAYSTGATIDEGRITGRVYGSGHYTVHLWKTVSDDSLFARPPLYWSDTNDEGVFRFKFLPAGDFSLVAVERSFAGMPLNPKRTAYGVPNRWSYHLPVNGSIDDLRIRPWTEPPPLQLERGEWLGKHWGWLYFNRPLKASEQLASVTLTPENGARVEANPSVDYRHLNKFVILTGESLPPGKMKVTVQNVFSDKPQDTAAFSLDLRVPAEQDTSYLELIQPDSVVSLRPDREGGPPLALGFSKPLAEVQNESFVLTTGDSDTVSVHWELYSPLWVELKPTGGWMPKTEYRLTVTTEGILPVEGRPFKDSSLTVVVHSGRRIGYGGLTGTVVDSTRKQWVTTLAPVKKPPRQYTAFVNSNLQFQYKDIPEGRYQLMLFDDRDGNGAYSFGEAYPFQPSEWFYVLPDTISIRANWDIDLSPIEIQEPSF